jgi:hypothetical protein
MNSMFHTRQKEREEYIMIQANLAQQNKQQRLHIRGYDSVQFGAVLIFEH